MGLFMFIAQITCIFFTMFWGIQSCRVRVRLKLGVFSDSNNYTENISCSKSKSQGAAYIRVRLKLGVLR